jgi:ankyrin repeat protein
MGFLTLVKLTGRGVLARYVAERLPEFAGIRLDGVNVQGNFGDYPLHIACVRGLTEEVLALIDAGADVNAAGATGNTPLHEAVSQAHAEVIAILLAKGANPLAEDEDGVTPVDMARNMRRKSLVALLEGR